MVAALDHVQGVPQGSLVLLRHALGRTRRALGTREPVQGWQALVIGGVSLEDVVVADHHLRPVSQLTEEEVEDLIQREAKAEFDRALADLFAYCEQHQVGPQELERALDTTASFMALKVAR
ncbi:MAG: hypothetical protein EP308_08085, partial [Burkholderiales bacterium]